MTLECFSCKRAGYPGEQIEYVKETKQIFEPDGVTPHVHKTRTAAAKATSYTPRSDTSSVTKNAEIRETQKIKQAHEIKLMESDQANAKLISDSNNAIAIALNKVADAIHEYAQANRLKQ